MASFGRALRFKKTERVVSLCGYLTTQRSGAPFAFLFADRRVPSRKQRRHP